MCTIAHFDQQFAQHVCACVLLLAQCAACTSAIKYLWSTAKSTMGNLTGGLSPSLSILRPQPRGGTHTLQWALDFHYDLKSTEINICGHQPKSVKKQLSLLAQLALLHLCNWERNGRKKTLKTRRWEKNHFYTLIMLSWGWFCLLWRWRWFSLKSNFPHRQISFGRTTTGRGGTFSYIWDLLVILHLQCITAVLCCGVSYIFFGHLWRLLSSR